MTTLDIELVNQIEDCIANLQKENVLLQDQVQTLKKDSDRCIEDSALRIIDILDMIHLMQSSLNADASVVIIQKITKRLYDILKQWQIYEITFPSGQIEVGKVRVIETRPASTDISTGTIIEICRKGYQRGNKIIRPADVITVK